MILLTPPIFLNGRSGDDNLYTPVVNTSCPDVYRSGSLKYQNDPAFPVQPLNLPPLPADGWQMNGEMYGDVFPS